MPIAYTNPNDNKLPSSVLPNNTALYTEVATLASLPVTGATNTLYQTIDNRKLFSWDGTQYQEVSPSSSTASPINVQKDGVSQVTGVNNINFTGSNITVFGSGGNASVSVASGSAIAISDEGTSLTTTPSSINFTGAGVTATSSSNAVTVNIPGGSGSSITFQDEGTNLTTALAQINAVGGGVTATTSGDNVTLTVPSKKTIVVDAMADVSVTISNPGTAIFNKQTVATGGKVFLAFQSAPAENGVYIFNGSGSAMTRATNYNTVESILESVVVVKNGVLNVAGTSWVNTNTSANLVTLGTDAITYKSLNSKGKTYIAKAINFVTNVTISNPGTAVIANGITFASGDVVLLASQTTATENGLYIFDTSSTPLVRLPNFRADEEIRSSTIFVQEGSRGASIYRNTNNVAITLGTSTPTFEWIAGNRANSVTTSTATGDFKNQTILISAASGAVTYTLATPSTMSGKQVVTKRTDTTTANAVTVAGHIDGNSSGTVSLVDLSASTGYNSFIFESNGTTWYIVGGFRLPLA
jgi:hypothetical protein